MLKKEHFESHNTIPDISHPQGSRYFWWLFKKRKEPQIQVRPGAMPPQEVKKTIESLGEGKIIEIIRIGYDGQIDDMPLIVQITGIYPEGFSGKIVNVEREMIEAGSETIVYARGGGGTVEFSYSDGDIKEIKVSEDEKLIAEERDISALQEILGALENGDNILISYFDPKHQGNVNAEGTILYKSPDNKKLKVLIEKINRVELEKKFEKDFDIERDLVIDLDIS